MFSEENEVLFPAGTSFFVESVQRKKNYGVIKLGIYLYY